jgi:hypothetical protein
MPHLAPGRNPPRRHCAPTNHQQTQLENLLSTRQFTPHYIVVVLSYGLSYAFYMTVLNFRTDERSERALAELMSDGTTASEAIRQALVDAVRLRRREQMRAESRELMNDEADRAESRRVLADMDELRAW